MSTAILVRRLRACALAPAVVVALATAVGAATPLPARTDRSIYDTAGVIEDADEAALEAEHKELFDKTGVAIVTITVPRLVDDTIEDFAVRAGQTWGVGKAGQDRGLVIALSVEDRKIFVATGYGTEGYLPDGKVGALLDREAIPALKKNRFSDGLVALDRALIGESAHEFGTTITGVPDRPVEQSRGSGIMTLLGIVVMVLIAMRHPWLFMLFGGFGGGGFGRRGRRDGGGDSGFGGFGGGGFGGGGAGRDF